MERKRLEEIIKFDKPEQFPVDEILNEDERIVRGWMSVEVKDKDGEIIPIKDLKRTLNTWMKRGGFITDQHSNRVVGKALRWYEAKHPKTGQPGIIVEYQIFKDYSIDDQVWKEIRAGKRKGLSFGGRALKQPQVKTDKYTGEPAKVLGGIEAYEVASVVEPANQFAENIAVNYLAKSSKTEETNETIKEFTEKLLSDLQKGYEVKDINKPFAGFKNFEECFEAQRKRGHSEDSAKRICGWLMHRFEGKEKTDDDIVDKFLEEHPEFEKAKYPWDKCIQDRLNEGYSKEQAQRICGAIRWRNRKKEEDVDKYEEPVRMRDMIAQEVFGKPFDELTDEEKDEVHNIAIQLKGKEKMTKSELSKEINNLLSTLNKDDESKVLNKKDLKDKRGGKMKEEMKIKEEENEESTKQEEESSSIEDRVSAIESKIDQILNIISQNQKQDEEETEEEKPEEEKPEEEMKEDKIEGTEEKQSPEGGKVILPKSPTGETDETAKPETDEVRVTEKELEKMVNKILKNKGITKVSTPRTEHDVIKNKEQKKEEFALDLMKKVREGKMSLADMNKEIKSFVKKQYNEGLRRILGKEGA